MWDFKAELSPSGPFRLGLRDLIADVPALPGAEDSELGALRSLFERAGLAEIGTRSINVTVEFPEFDTFWLAQTPSYAPTTKLIDTMSASDHARLIEAVRARLPTSSNGSIRYPARANAVTARANG